MILYRKHSLVELGNVLQLVYLSLNKLVKLAAINRNQLEKFKIAAESLKVVSLYNLYQHLDVFRLLIVKAVFVFLLYCYSKAHECKLDVFRFELISKLKKKRGGHPLEQHNLEV